jgi:hypothetical protein
MIRHWGCQYSNIGKEECYVTRKPIVNACEHRKASYNCLEDKRLFG